MSDVYKKINNANDIVQGRTTIFTGKGSTQQVSLGSPTSVKVNDVPASGGKYQDRWEV